MMKSFSIEVLIVENSASTANLLKQTIQTDPRLRVIASLSSGEEVLCYLQHNIPDVIVVDFRLPYMDGFETVQEIMQTSPVPIVMLTTDPQTNDIQNSFKAFQAGALEVIYFPVQADDQTFTTHANALIKAIHNASIIKLITRPYFNKCTAPTAEEERIKKLLAVQSIQAIAIGASLGGPTALNTIFSQLPAAFPLPIFVVQHIAPGYNQGLVNWIQKTSPLKIVLAEEGQIAEPGIVYFAPENFHLELLPFHTIHLNPDPPEDGLRPAVSRLFRSMAKTYGNQSMGIILTGMGHDGAKDLRLMRDSGAITIAQDQKTAFVFGMPKEAIACGAALSVLSLKQIISVLKTLAEVS